MGRTRLLDRLQNYRFHLFDVSWQLSLPPFALNPVLGFSSITAPEVTLETEEHAEGNHWFKRHLISGGSISNITLSRGASFFDSEFWIWMKASIRGNASNLNFAPTLSGKRRNLLLVQYTGYSWAATKPDSAGDVNTDLADAATAALGFLPSPNSVLAVPGRAWMLMHCLPVRYKAGSDMDATSGDISIAELEFSLDGIEEIGAFA